MTFGLHGGSGFVIEIVFERDRVRGELVVQARTSDGVGQSQILVENVPEGLRNGGDDVAAARSAGEEGESSVAVFDNDRADGAERTLPGLNEVR